MGLQHSGLQQSARPHIRVSVGDEKWSNSRVPAAYIVSSRHSRRQETRKNVD